MVMKVSTSTRGLALGLGMAVGFLLVFGAVAHEEKQPGAQTDEKAAQTSATMGGHMMAMPGAEGLMMPQMDSARGRKLFASKGCVACHSINGVGGHDATALDAHTMQPMMNPFDFAAKMWRMAPVMIAAQEEALGEQILFTGQELADIVAFVHDDAEQHKFSRSDIPPEIMPLMHHVHAGAGGTAADEDDPHHDHSHEVDEDHHDEMHGADEEHHDHVDETEEEHHDD